MIDEKKLIEELEAMPFIHGRYDHKNGNPDFIRGIESWHEIVLNKIEQQPKVMGWIPVSERLPEEDGMYLISADVLGKSEVQYVFYQKSLQLFINNGTAIAWMPLPSPWKGEEDV